MGHIAGRGGRFVTVMPRSRKEDKAFRDWIQTHTPVWTEAARRPGPRLGEPDEIYATTTALAPSAEGYRILWVHSTAKAGRDAASRMARTEAGIAAIDALDAKLAGPRNRLKTRVAVTQAATVALAQARADRWVTFTIGETTTKTYKQAGPGRPGAATNYREVLTTGYTVTADINLDRIAYDAASDGCFPLITCDQQLDDAAVLAAYPLPAQPRTTTPPAQVRPRRSAGPAAQPGPDRSPVLLAVPRPAPGRPHRTRSPNRHDPRSPGHHRALPRAPQLQRTLDRTDPGDLRHHRPPRPPPRQRPREDVPPRTHHTAATSPRPTRTPRNRLHPPQLIDAITRPRSAERQTRRTVVGR